MLRQGGRDAGIFTAKGLVLLEMGRSWEAVCTLHEALAVGPQDPVATDLLSRALEENASEQGWGGQPGGQAAGVGNSFVDDVEEEADLLVKRKREEVRRKGGGARVRRGRGGMQGDEAGGDGDGAGVGGVGGGEDSTMVMSDEE